MSIQETNLSLPSEEELIHNHKLCIGMAIILERKKIENPPFDEIHAQMLSHHYECRSPYNCENPCCFQDLPKEGN